MHLTKFRAVISFTGLSTTAGAYEEGTRRQTLALMASIAFLTALFHSAGGFAGGLLLVICLTPQISFKAAVPLVAVSNLISNTTHVWAYRHQITWSVYRSVMITAVSSMILGELAFVHLPTGIITLILAIFLIFSVPMRRVLNGRGLAGVGAVSGILSVTTMGAGMPMAPFYLGAGLLGGEVIAMNAATGLTLNVVKSVVFGFSPLLNVPWALTGVPIGLFAIPGAFLGRWIVNRTETRMHTALVEAVIIMGGIYFLSSSF